MKHHIPSHSNLIQRAGLLLIALVVVLGGCSSGSGSTRYYDSASYVYGDFYYDRWGWGSCCYYPGYPIGPPKPPKPKPEHPIERPPKPKPEHPIERPPKPKPERPITRPTTPKPSSRPITTPRPMPRPVPAARPARMR
jgi:hypothetical protein